MVIGYARVSTAAQHEDRQVAALREYGIPPDNIYVDKYSGQNTERPNYQRIRSDILREGDTPYALTYHTCQKPKFML